MGGESYAKALSKNVSDTKKSAIAENIQSHKKADIRNSTLEVCGIPEDGQDYAYMRDMLAFFGCPGDVARHERIGRISNNKPTVRPIKVVLRSASGREYILSRAYFPKEDTFYSRAYISRWLS